MYSADAFSENSHHCDAYHGRGFLQLDFALLHSGVVQLEGLGHQRVGQHQTRGQGQLEGVYIVNEKSVCR